MRKLLSPLLLLGLLSACGGSHHDDTPVTTTPPVTTAPTPVPDTFTVQVATIVAAQSDTAEPTAIDGAPTVTMPENTEPEPVQ